MAATPTVEEIRKAQRATGPATVLAIGTATPSNCVLQADYPDYYFRITNSEHMTELKEKFRRMCTFLVPTFGLPPSSLLMLSRKEFTDIMLPYRLISNVTHILSLIRLRV